MIDDGLILKTDYNQFPKKTEYSLILSGEQLTPVFGSLPNSETVFNRQKFSLIDSIAFDDTFAPELKKQQWLRQE